MRERRQHLVVDQRRHVLPASLLGQGVELGLHVLPRVQLERRQVGGRRGVERQVGAGALLGLGQRLLVAAGDDDGLADDGARRRIGTGALDPLVERRPPALAEEAGGVERVQQGAVGELAGHAGHQRTDGSDDDRRYAVGVGPGVERRRHQGVAVVLAAVVELAAVLPGVEDRLEGLDEVAHSIDRVLEAARRSDARCAPAPATRARAGSARPSSAWRSQAIDARWIGLRGRAMATAG